MLEESCNTGDDNDTNADSSNRSDMVKRFNSIECIANLDHQRGGGEDKKGTFLIG